MKKKYLFLSLGAFSLLFAACNNSGTISKGNYTLTLNGNGGNFSGSTTKVYTDAGTISAASALTTPTKAATTNYTYTFNGWYDGKSNSSNAITFPYTLSANTTFYAHWDETATQKYTVTFDANGGKFSDGTSSFSLSTAKVRKNDASAIVPSRDNYEFLGWWFSTTAKNDPVSFPYVPTADITIHAMWGEGDGYSVTLDPDGGTFTDGTTTNKELTEQYVVNFSGLDKPTKTNGSGQNYSFIGWGTTEGGTSVCSGKQILDDDLTLYAIWSDPSSSDFAIYTDSTASYTKSGSEYSFNTTGTYTLTGNLSSGNITVNPVDEGTVIIDINGCSITSSSQIPIYIGDYADKVKIKAEESTTNYIYDNRTTTNGDVDGGAIYSLTDLDFVGKGSLHIEGNINNGIHCKKDLNIKNQTLYVKGANNAIRGNNSITIESGNITAVAVGGDGLKTSDNGTSSSGKQKGNIEIYGGTIDIDSYGDGIQAAYDTIIESSYDDDGNELVPNVDVKTYKYAETGGETPETETLYIRSTTNLSSYDVVVYSYTGSTTHIENTAEYKGTEEVESGGGGMGPGGGTTTTTYYLWTLTRPTGYSSLKILVRDKTTGSQKYYTSGNAYNSSYNMITLSKTTSSKLSFNWGIHDATSELSAKGIKVENEVSIYNSQVNIEAFGNGIHANADSTIESTSSYGNGTINICDGTVTIYSDNKGAHADNYLNVTGGNTYVTNAYEGYEASQININGGQTHIYATDDGFNAGSKDSSITNKQINVTGGYVDIQTSSGDTDGIDSNGTFTQTGGIVVSRASSNNQMSTALDTDGQSTISGSAIFVAVGAQAEADRENRLTCSNKSSVSKSFTANTSHTINSSYTFTVTLSYSLYYYYLGSSASAPSIS